LVAAVEKLRTETEGGPDSLDILAMPDPPLGQPWRRHRDLAAGVTDDSRLEIDFGDEDAIGRLDARNKRLSLEHRKLPPGTLLYVGFVAEGIERAAGLERTRPLPFNRALYAVLRHADNFDRASSLAGLAARLSWSEAKESVLAEAARSARLIADRDRRSQALALIASQYPHERRADYLEEAGRGAVLTPVPMPEPAPDDGRHWGRFVVLWKKLRHGIAYLSPDADRLWPETAWRGFYKVIRLAAEVEVAPELLRLSVREGLEYNPESAPLWRRWLEEHLPEGGLRDSMLSLLPDAR
jgi:hypothetical protein